MIKMKRKEKTPEYKYDNPSKGDNWGAIRICSGDFKGVVYRYGLVSFSETDSLRCTFNFTHDIVLNPNHMPINEELKEQMGLILLDILENNYSESEESDDDRTINTI